MENIIDLQPLGKDHSGVQSYGMPRQKPFLIRALLALADGYKQLAIWLLTKFVLFLAYAAIMAILFDIHPILVTIPAIIGLLVARGEL